MLEVKQFFALSMVLLITLSSMYFSILANWMSQENDGKDFHIGVTFCSNTMAKARLLVDRVNHYANLFAVDSEPST
jgi:hypothetical protein